MRTVAYLIGDTLWSDYVADVGTIRINDTKIEELEREVFTLWEENIPDGEVSIVERVADEILRQRYQTQHRGK